MFEKVHFWFTGLKKYLGETVGGQFRAYFGFTPPQVDVS